MPFFSLRKKQKHQPSSSLSTLQSAHRSTLSLHPNPSSYPSSPDPVLYRRFSEAPTSDNNNNTTTTTTTTTNHANNPPSSHIVRPSRTVNRSVPNIIQNPVHPQAESLESIPQSGAEPPLAESLSSTDRPPVPSSLHKSKTVLTRPVATDRPGILRRSFSKSKRSPTTGHQGLPGTGPGTRTGAGTGPDTNTGTGTESLGPGVGASASASPRLKSMPEEEQPRVSLSSNRSKESINSSSSNHPQDKRSGSHLDMADRTQTPAAGRQSPYPPESRNNSQSTLEQGRGTPAPGQKEDDVRGLAQKHDELLAKYSKVKRYYFEKDAQVQHLQNTVAHQRMAVSRTVLDDNEYANRFGRLDGAIKDLAFSIRRDWQSLPHWLLGYVNDDAHTVGAKEMTAIGRAFMSRWLVEEIFQRHFHPALDPTFSQQLKNIENNLRHQHLHITATSNPSPNTAAANSGSHNNNNGSSSNNNSNNNSNNSNSGSSSQPAVAEDKENAIAKISNWRRTTFDGLGDETLLQSPAAEENRRNLTEQLVGRLVSTLRTHLSEPPPVGMDNSARMIVENAVGIAEKIPLESRDVLVVYPLPGSLLADQRMKVETGVPPLTNVRAKHRPDQDSEDPDTEDTASSSKEKDISAPPSPTNPPGGSGPEPKKKSSSSMFSTLMGKRPPPPQQPSQQQQQQSLPHGQPGKDDEKGPARIRFAAFMHAEVQGKGPVNVLARAPVYLLE